MLKYRLEILSLLIWLFFFTTLKKAQSQNIDFQKDSTQLFELLKSTKQHAFKDFSIAITDIQRALALAQKLNNNQISFTVFRKIGSLYEQNYRFQEAAECYGKALNLQGFASPSKKLDIYLDWAIINKKLFHYNIAKNYYLKIIEYGTEIQDMEMVQYAYCGLGSMHTSLSDYGVAMNDYIKANEVAENRKDKGGSITINTNMASLHTQTGSYDLAYALLEKANNLALATKDSLRLGCLTNEYGKIFIANKNYQKAILYHQNALVYFKKSANKRMIAETLGLIAKVYTEAKLYENAEKTFNECFNYIEYFEFYEHPNLYLKVGNLYLKTQKTTQAKDMFLQCLTLANTRGFKDLIEKSNRGLADVFELEGDFKKSLQYHKMAEAYKDTLAADDKIKHLAEVEYKYNLGKAEAGYKLNMAHKEKQIQILLFSKQRNIIIFLSAFLMGVLIFSFYFIKHKAKSNLTLSQKNTEIKLKNDRLEKSNEILQQFAYASAHDLKEPLRSISGFVSIINKKYVKLLPPEASDYMKFVVIGVKRMESLIAALLEYSTVAADTEDINQSTPIADILGDVKRNLYAVILEKKAIITSNSALPAIKMSRLHLTQLFQNLISNAIKFSDKTPLIEISSTTENDHFILEIKDNGIGIKLEYSDKIFRLFQRLSRSSQYDGTGIGLAICKQIVDKYNGTIHFESVENRGTTFYLTFPLDLIDTAKTLKNSEAVEHFV